MGLALLSAKRSKDPSTQVGCCIVDHNNKIVAVGYNGMPQGLSDDEFPWGREGDFLNTKYAYVCHAELNAILNSTVSSLEKCTLYTTLFPCNECTKSIIQKGIKSIIYLSDKYADTDVVKVSKLMMDSAGVKYDKFNKDKDEIILRF